MKDDVHIITIAVNSGSNEKLQKFMKDREYTYTVINDNSGKLAKKFGFEVDIAGTLQEAKVFVQNNNEYFIALLDLNLPDAPDGEIVDYIASKGIPSIVLTSNMNKQTRDEILKKDVIDYVYKVNMDDVYHILNLIERLLKNREYKVMIVDDSIVTRNEVKRIIVSENRFRFE